MNPQGVRRSRGGVPAEPVELSLQDDDAGTFAVDPAQLLPAQVARWARTDPARPFLEEVTGATLSYGETWDAARRWATWLHGRGVRRGDRVITLLPASIDTAVAWLGLGLLGAVDVPVNPELRGRFLEHALTDPAAALCLARPEHASLVSEVGVAGLSIVPLERGSDPAATCSPCDAELPAPGDPSCIIYTSGTTGLPKGVLLSWAQFAATVGRIPRSWLSGSDAVYLCHPVFHVTGRSPFPTMADVGGRVVLRERFSASEFLADVRTHGCTSTTAYLALLLATRSDRTTRTTRCGCAGAATSRRWRTASRSGSTYT